MASVAEQLLNESNMAAITQAQQKAREGVTVKSESSNSVSSFEFLKLLTEQLKYQDPTNPMDNTDMLAQEAQFSTLEQMEALQSGFSEFANVYKANSLMGKLVDIDNNGKEVTGVVEYVSFNDTSGAAVTVNGNNYPLSQVKGIYPYGVDTAEQDSAAEDRGIIKEALGVIGDNLGSITKKISEYIKNNSNSGNS